MLSVDFTISTFFSVKFVKMIILHFCLSSTPNQTLKCECKIWIQNLDLGWFWSQIEPKNAILDWIRKTNADWI